MMKEIKFSILFLLFFSGSLLLLNYYTEGDQIYYHKYYNAVKDVNFFGVPFVAHATISSGEPISQYVLWLGAKLGVSKNIWVSFLNVILLFGIWCFLKKYNARRYLFLFIFTNFYLLVLLTGAERLKIAYIFLVYAFVFSGKVRFIILSLMPMAHFQTLVLISVFFVQSTVIPFKTMLSEFRVKASNLLMLAMVIVLLLVFMVFFGSNLLVKVLAYLNFSNFFSHLNVILLLFVALMCSRKPLTIVICLLVFLPFVTLLGPERINMMAVSFVIGYFLIYGYKNVIVFNFLLMYLSLKSLPFVYNIFVHNNGFGGFLF